MILPDQWATKFIIFRVLNQRSKKGVKKRVRINPHFQFLNPFYTTMKFAIVVSVWAAASSASTVGANGGTIAACPGGGAYCCSRCAVNLQDCFDACGESLKNCPYPGGIFQPTERCGAECCGNCVPPLADGTVSFQDCLSKCGVRCGSTILPVCRCPERNNRIHGVGAMFVEFGFHGLGPLVIRPSNALFLPLTEDRWRNRLWHRRFYAMLWGSSLLLR
jgi:hypothetical protein